jgi:hypothetical protein
MNTPLVTIALGLAVIGLAAYLYQHFSGRRHTEFDGGVVSQSWLIEHRASTQDDRYR